MTSEGGRVEKEDQGLDGLKFHRKMSRKNETETCEGLPKGATVSSAFFRLLFRSVGVVGAAAWADPALAAIGLELEIRCCGPPLLLPPPLLPPRSGVRSSSFVLLSVSRISSRSEDPVLRFESWLCWCCCCCCRCCWCCKGAVALVGGHPLPKPPGADKLYWTG